MIILFFIFISILYCRCKESPQSYCYYQSYLSDDCSGDLDNPAEFFYVMQDECVQDVWNEYWWIFKIGEGNDDTIIIDGFTDKNCTNRTQHEVISNGCQSIAQESWKYVCNQEYPIYEKDKESRTEFFSGTKCDGEKGTWIITYKAKPLECITWKSGDTSFVYNCTESVFWNEWFDGNICNKEDDIISEKKKCNGVGQFTPTFLTMC